jgi:hypothetical protein
MRGGIARAGRLLAVPALALVVVVVFLPGYVDVAVRVDALVVCGLVVLVAIAALRRAYPPTSPLRPKRRPSTPAPPPPTLTRLEKDVALGVAGSFELHYRLRPRLRSLARIRLATHRGISLDDEPDAARDVLGDAAWDLVRPDRPPPENRLAGGLPVPALTDVVDAMERV